METKVVTCARFIIFSMVFICGEADRSRKGKLFFFLRYFEYLLAYALRYRGLCIQ